MQIGMVGLGRMGANMVRRLVRHGHRCVVFDRSEDAVKKLVGESVTGAISLVQLVSQLAQPRAVWVMLPAGEITEATITELGELLAAGDIIVDGGNAFYKDDVRRAKALKSRGIHYVDCGTSGGIWGLDRGYCLMIGGDKEAVDRLDPVFKSLAPGPGNIDVTPGRRGAGPAGGARLHALRPERRRAFRQDDPQRHRVRNHAGLCGGLQHPSRRGRRRAARGPALPTRPDRHRGAVAARQRHRIMASRSHRDSAGKRSEAVGLLGRSSRIPARAAGP